MKLFYEKFEKDIQDCLNEEWGRRTAIDSGCQEHDKIHYQFTGKQTNINPLVIILRKKYMNWY